MQEEMSAVGFVEYKDDIAAINITQKRLVTPQDGNALKIIVDAIVKKGYKKIVFSFREVEFMSSSLLGVLIAISTQLRNIKGAIKITGVSPSIREIFTITNLDKVFKIT